MPKPLVFQGDNREVLRSLIAQGVQVDAVVTDPPYGLEFMGKSWDTPWKHTAGFRKPGFAERPIAWPQFGSRCQMQGFQKWCEEWAALVLQVLKPGGHMLSFGGTRTYHRMVCALEDAGFEIRDQLAWIYGSGFPKSQSVLKPALEPICLARKPLSESTIAANVVKHGTGVINVDGCRIESGKRPKVVALGDKRCGHTYDGSSTSGQFQGSASAGVTTLGRWPANLLFDEEAAQALDERSSGASRFFYISKASKRERDGSKHPTVKPITLMRYLCRLITPPGGTILDPFAGSGTTGEAAVLEGFTPLLIEQDKQYIPDIRRRLKRAA